MSFDRNFSASSAPAVNPAVPPHPDPIQTQSSNGSPMLVSVASRASAYRKRMSGRDIALPVFVSAADSAASTRCVSSFSFIRRCDNREETFARLHLVMTLCRSQFSVSWLRGEGNARRNVVSTREKSPAHQQILHSQTLHYALDRRSDQFQFLAWF